MYFYGDCISMDAHQNDEMCKCWWRPNCLMSIPCFSHSIILCKGISSTRIFWKHLDVIILLHSLWYRLFYNYKTEMCQSIETLPKFLLPPIILFLNLFCFFIYRFWFWKFLAIVETNEQRNIKIYGMMLLKHLSKPMKTPLWISRPILFICELIHKENTFIDIIESNQVYKYLPFALLFFPNNHNNKNVFIFVHLFFPHRK